MPVTGTYTVIVSQDYGLPTSLQLTLLPQVGGAIVADGPPPAPDALPPLVL